MIKIISTNPFEGQKPGTSGLRKKVKVFTQKNYTENFVQCILDANGVNLSKSTLIVGGDGRFYGKEASELIIKMCGANGVSRLMVGQNGILSTPAVSSLIRHHKALGGIVLTASHNPGGPEEDFGIKFNCANGGPAPDHFTNSIYELSTKITSFKIVDDIEIDIGKIGINNFNVDGKHFVVEIIDPVANYVSLMEEIFDFERLATFVTGKQTGKPLKMRIDAMNGVTGPYVEKIFVDCLGASMDSVVHTKILPDFGGLHPDPNLTYAKDLVDAMTIGDYEIGAAFDGDGDRNMIIGRSAFFVSPGDSLAVIAHYLDVIPYFKKHSIQGFARSMPTCSAIDKVAKALNKECFEVPTGWKYFGNLMDAGRLCLCGEESFGTGSNHIREKDGIWALLAWMSIMESTQKSIEDILIKHWKMYGRNYFTRFDYEGCDAASCNEMISTLEQKIADPNFVGQEFSHPSKSYKVKLADNFSYNDPIDKSLSTKQGLRIVFTDDSRIIIRLSGTGSSGATVRLYIDSYEKENVLGKTAEMLEAIINIATNISELAKFTGRNKPDVIT